MICNGLFSLEFYFLSFSFLGVLAVQFSLDSFARSYPEPGMNVFLRVTAGPHAGREYTFDRHETFVVGRSSQVQFPVPEDGFLSRNHFLIEVNPPVCFLRDLGSTNGTKVNGHRVDTVRLRDGDTISAGESSFVIRVEETTWEGRPKIHCLGCGKHAPADLAIS